jgi:hypothetical protein
MGKKLLLIFSMFFVCLMLTRTCTTNASTPIFAVDPPSQIITEPGITFKVNITVTDSPAVVQWALNVTWDPETLNFTSITEGNFLKQKGSTMFLSKPAQPGILPEVTCILMVAGTVNGSGTLCEITFNATAMDVSDININWGVLIDEDGYEITPILVNGTATVVPEFPNSMLLPMFLTATITTALIARTLWSRKRRGPILAT